jgi:hypothetical protein
MLGQYIALSMTERFYIHKKQFIQLISPKCGALIISMALATKVVLVHIR